MNSIELNLFASRLEFVCDEMGLVLRKAAFSPNIRDRLDYSCAVFDAKGALCAQAAHIPVHLGSMAYAMQALVSIVDWQVGDQLIVNNPYMGGTHLPDITLVSPVFVSGKLQAFVVNRAHYADIGADTPGSMPISRNLSEEGLVISPQLLVKAGDMQAKVLDSLLGAVRSPEGFEGDLSAQISANLAGDRAMSELIGRLGSDEFNFGLLALNQYAEKLSGIALQAIPDGCYAFEDSLDDDGQGNKDIKIKVQVSVTDGQVCADFTGTAEQVEGNVNCPISVAVAGVYYVFRCLMPAQTPSCAGAFNGINVIAPQGCLLNANAPAAVAAGNVETSSRVVDVVMGALAQALPERLPAASHGSMNNVAMGSDDQQGGWDYYETIGGGMGAGASGGGLSAIQTHMTNTLNTPVEVLEGSYPLRISRYEIRQESGGSGLRPGGNGLIREYEFLAPAQFSLLTERRRHQPWGLAGGKPGQSGANLLNGREITGKCHYHVDVGDKLCIKTPGGGAFKAN